MPKKTVRKRNQVQVLPKGKKTFKINGLRRFLLPTAFGVAEKIATPKAVGV